MNEKIPRNKTLPQKSYQRDKRLSCNACKKRRAIFEIDSGRTSTNGPREKKVDNNALGLTSER